MEEEEAKDSFDVDVAVTNPEKIGQSRFILRSFCFVKARKLFIMSCAFIYIMILFGKQLDNLTFQLLLLNCILLFDYTEILISESIILISL